MAFPPDPPTGPSSRRDRHAAPAAAAFLTGGCDGYAAGTTGRVTGHRQGCAEFVPDAPGAVARWARPRTTLLVPDALVTAGRRPPLR